jgi:hypothetical protein
MTDPLVISAPGIYDQIPAVVYHADPTPTPSLSSSIAKRLCLDSPRHAWYEHPRLSPQPVREERESFDIGTVAHALLLEQQTGVIVVDAPDWRTKAAREARDAAPATRRVALLARHWAAVQAMVGTAREQLDAQRDGGAAMFTDGRPEQTLIWQEEDIWCRARLDWLRPGGIDDYKTTDGSANPERWTRSLFFAGYDLQAAFYLRGLKAITGEDVTFRFAVQEIYPPYALSVIGLGPDALMLAEKKILYALEVWRRSLAENSWPGYPTRTCYATLSPVHEAWWLERELR